MAKLNTAIRGAQVANAVAGDGLVWTTDDVMGVDLKASGGLKIDTAELAVEPNDFAGAGLADDGSDNLKVDLNSLGAGVVDVSADSIAIVDADDDGSKKETIADIMTAVAGSGITATAGVLSVDAVADNIVEDDIQLENESANCDSIEVAFTLSNTPIANSLQVFLNGIIQEEGSGKDYTYAGTTVTFSVAPETGDILLIHYITDN